MADLRMLADLTDTERHQWLEDIGRRRERCRPGGNGGARVVRSRSPSVRDGGRPDLEPGQSAVEDIPVDESVVRQRAAGTAVASRAPSRRRRGVAAAHLIGMITAMPKDPTPVSIDVPIPTDPYKIVIGRGLLDQISEYLVPPRLAVRAALVTSDNIFELYGERVVNELEKIGLRVHLVIVPDGEESKNSETLEECYVAFGRMPLGRRDIVVALGGGVIGDLAGFAAATWARGVPVVQIATTLVAQVDSAIGGKTGINIPAGKNLVGAFHQPLVVLSDTETLRTLPERELRAGLAEVVKYGFIADTAILDLLNAASGPEALTDLDLLDELVRRSAVVKARVVGDDVTEAGGREVLNYGHTVGHAIETLSSYNQYRHGEAVSIGMVFAARLGEKLGVSEPGLADHTVRALSQLGLPTGGVSYAKADVWDVMSRDKKARAGVRFVLCPRPGEVVVIDPPDTDVVNEVLDSLA
jgi:3-dehydroquinate synthase